jgi:hypothetical protein
VPVHVSLLCVLFTYKVQIMNRNGKTGCPPIRITVKTEIYICLAFGILQLEGSILLHKQTYEYYIRSNLLSRHG